MSSKFHNIIKEVLEINQDNKEIIYNLEKIDKLLEGYVIIKKLETRHQDADILHDIVELGEGQWTHEDDPNWEHFSFSEIERYRLYENKEEQEYEYQWLINGKVASLNFITKEEMDTLMARFGFTDYEPIPDTKKRTSK